MRKGRRRKLRIKRKVVALRLHTRKRARQRYGLHLVRDDLEQIVGQIQRREDAYRVMDQSNRKSHWLVWYRERWLPVVYDRGRHAIVTVLPQSVLAEYRKQVGV
jgi:hypothetical protein